MYISRNKKIVEVDPDDHICELADFLDLSKDTTFVFGGKTYHIWQEQTFREIGLMDEDVICIRPQVCGGGPLTKICPQGCGRQIPEQYESCSALLKAQPDYFD